MAQRFENRTRVGNDVRVYDDDVRCSEGFTIHGAVFYPGKDRWIPQAWTGAGRVLVGGDLHPLDLVPVEIMEVMS